MICKKLSLSCLALLMGLVFVTNASAAMLKVDGFSQLEFLIDNEQVTISGSYRIRNNGGEPVYNVSPILRVGGWSWSGPPENLLPADNYDWEVSEVVPLATLTKSAGLQCLDFEPRRGFFPLYIMRKYQDINGFQFSAADLLKVELGELSGGERGRLQAPPVKTKLELAAGTGQSKATGSLTVRNLSDEPIKLALTTHVGRELSARADQSCVEVPPHSQESYGVEVEEFNAVPGSNYPVIVIAEWRQGELANFDRAIGRFVIGPKKVDNPTPWIAAVLGVGTVVLLVGIGFALRWQKRSSD